MKNYSWTLAGLMAVALGLVLALSCAADTATLLTACEEGKKIDLAEEASLLLLRDTCLAEWDSLKPNEDNLWKERVIHRELAMQCTRNLTRCNKAHASLTSDSGIRTDADGSSSSGKHLLQKRIEDSSLEESLEQFFEQSSQPFVTPLERDNFPERAPRSENLAFSLSYCESVRAYNAWYADVVRNETSQCMTALSLRKWKIATYTRFLTAFRQQQAQCKPALASCLDGARRARLSYVFDSGFEPVLAAFLPTSAPDALWNTVALGSKLFEFLSCGNGAYPAEVAATYPAGIVHYDNGTAGSDLYFGDGAVPLDPDTLRYLHVIASTGSNASLATFAHLVVEVFDGSGVFQNAPAAALPCRKRELHLGFMDIEFSPAHTIENPAVSRMAIASGDNTPAASSAWWNDVDLVLDELWINVPVLIGIKPTGYPDAGDSNLFP